MGDQDEDAGGVRRCPQCGCRQPVITFVSTRRKLLKDLTADDIPPGLDPEDVAIDYAPDYDETKRPT